MFHDSFIAAIRTGVATVVGIFITFLISKGFEIDTDTQTQLTAVLVVLVTAAYNWAVIQLEKHVNPYFGILLGVPKAPTYHK
jgi:hypothetical protein